VSMMKVLAVMTYFQISLPTHNWDSAINYRQERQRGKAWVAMESLFHRLDGEWSGREVTAVKTATIK
ncbi:hypothetical protein ACK31W_18305, partial [Aeromonas caviae]